MGNSDSNPRPQTDRQTYYVEIPEATIINKQKKIAKVQKNTPINDYESEQIKLELQTKSKEMHQIFSEKVEWPQNHINVPKLPDVKPPKKQYVKKTKQAKENLEQEQEIEQLDNIRTQKSQSIDIQTLNNRGKTAPLILSKDNPLHEFGKTKKCKVSRML